MKKLKLKKITGADIKGQFSSTSYKNGAMSMGMVAIVVCIVIVLNMVMGQLPESIRNLDLTDNKLYEITDTSREILSDLDKEIDITVLAERDSTDDKIKTFLSKYTALSDKITVDWIDPVQHPSALETYDAEANSIVIHCPDTDKSTTVSFNDILVVDEMSYYTSGSSDPTSFDGEGQLTSAIHYVISDTSKNIYQTTGHGEGTLGTSVTDLMDKMNLQVNDLNLLMETQIPEDCDLLLMYAPTNDITEDEANVLKEYLNQGGKMYLMLGASEDSLPNLEGIMKDYGLAMADGYIADVDRCYQGNYYYIFPQLNVSGDLADGISSQMVLLVNARGMTQTETEDENLTVSSFMTTSDQAYAVTEDGQEEGNYLLGAVATKTIDTEGEDADADSDSDDEDSDSEEESATEARLTVISTPTMIDEQITSSFSTLENLTLFMNTISANFDDIENVAIEAKSLEVTYNTMQHAGLISLGVIFGIPLIVLIGGFMVWWRRRKA